MTFACPHCGESYAAGERPECECVAERQRELEALREERDDEPSQQVDRDVAARRRQDKRDRQEAARERRKRSLDSYGRSA